MMADALVIEFQTLKQIQLTLDTLSLFLNNPINEKL